MVQTPTQKASISRRSSNSSLADSLSQLSQWTRHLPAQIVDRSASDSDGDSTRPQREKCSYNRDPEAFKDFAESWQDKHKYTVRACQPSEPVVVDLKTGD